MGRATSYRASLPEAAVAERQPDPSAQPVEFRHENHALLLLRICTRNHGDQFLIVAEIVGQMRHPRCDVNEVASFRDPMVLEPVSVPRSGLAAEDVDGTLVSFVLVSLADFSGRHSEQLHVQRIRPDGLSGDGGGVEMALLAPEWRSGLHNA